MHAAEPGAGADKLNEEQPQGGSAEEEGYEAECIQNVEEPQESSAEEEEGRATHTHTSNEYSFVY